MSHLTAKAPLRLHLRHAFHDWMWNGGGKDECGWRRRLARRLPLYFTDPYLDGIPRNPKKRMAWFESLEPSETVGPQPPAPLTLAGGTTTTLRWTATGFVPVPQTSSNWRGVR